MFFKEEPTDAKELRDVIEYMYEELDYLCRKPDYDKIVDKCINTTSRQLQNPLLNYRYYLIFEDLMLCNFMEICHDDLSKIPLWIFHNGSDGMKNVIHHSTDKFHKRYYEAKASNITNLDDYGELYELFLFLEDLPKTFKKLLQEYEGFFYDDFLLEIYKEIVHPEWKTLIELPEYSKWNKKYEPEDWLYHGVL